MTPALTRRLYMFAWLTLGSIALAYFLVLFQSAQTPEKAGDSSSVFARSPLADTATGTADPAVSQALTRMNSEIDALKLRLEAAHKENAALTAHIKTLETAYGPSTAALPPQPKRPDRSAADIRENSHTPPQPKIDVTLLPMPADGFAESIIEAPLPIAGLGEPRRTRFAVQIASDLKAGAVETRWAELNRRHPMLLAELQPRKIAAANDTYRLVVGPFNNAAAAAMLCARLAAAGTTCEGTVFAGSPVGGVAAR